MIPSAALTDAGGAPFTSWRAFALHLRPEGIGCTAEQLDRLNDAAKRSVADVGREALPTGKVGAPAGNKNATSADVDQDNPYPIRIESKRGNDPSYLAGRIKAKAAKGDELAKRVATAVERGDYDAKGMRAAARDAGIVKPPDLAKAATRALSKLPSEQLDRLNDAAKRSVADVGREALPTGKVGAPAGNKNATSADVDQINRYQVTIDSKRGNDTSYLAGRIKAKAAKGDELR